MNRPYDDGTVAMQYAYDVLEGSVLACKYVRLAVQRHVSDLETGEERGLWFDKATAQLAVEFFPLLRHHKGRMAGKPFELEPWQQFIISVFFGWKREDGTRRFRTSYIEVARKNGKTTLNAGKTLYHLLLDDESGAQVYFVATKEEQARICFDDVAKILDKSPAIRARFRTFRKSITHGGSFMKPLGSDSKTQDGFDPSYGVIDEYHAHPDDSMLNVVESGMKERVQPVIDVITTAGFNLQGPCYRLRKTMIDILEGRKTDDSQFGIIFTLDEGDDWEDESVWQKANPLWNDTTLSYLRDQYVKAKNEGSSKIVNFQTKNLNLWVDAPTVWIDSKVYDSNAKGMNPAELLGKKCYGGLDIGSSGDLSAFVLLFVKDRDVVRRIKQEDGSFETEISREEAPYAVLSFFWIPEEKLKNNADQVDYLAWVEQGHIKKMAGRTIDNDQVANDILEIVQPYAIHSVAYDPYKADHGIIKNLEDAGITCNHLAQTVKVLGVPTDGLESVINEGQLEHFGNPVLKWMFGNVVIMKDSSGNIKPDKRKSANKIDGVSACVNAIGEWITYKNDDDESVYEKRGIISF